MNYLFLISVFIISSIVGYLLISNIPSLLHTPLMSGTNALSGVTLIGAFVAASILVRDYNKTLGVIFGSLSILFAVINVVGGFIVTDRMLKMFSNKGNKK